VRATEELVKVGRVRPKTTYTPFMILMPISLAVGEFDIMESVNGLDQVYGTLHCGTDPGGVCDETNGLGSTIPCSGSTCQGNFHTYAIEVNTKSNPQTLTWTLDGVAYQTLNNNTLGAAVWKSAVLDAKFMLLNVVSLVDSFS
jgi:hypothetical protein